ncbi:DUF4190 domain-containing protein [Amycolatopsis sp. NPDC058278]|uniref:DUF4190 domain-containing protein n=1 Tax=Amycolatopsis sp. NPDC058278 TaxID=3346417 RepID=UPI0036DA351D
MTYPQDPNNPYGRQYPPSGGYQQPGYGQQYPSGGYPPQYQGYPGTPGPPREGSGLAVGALVCSILGIFLCVLVTVAGIIMGHIAYGKAKRGEAEGQGVAMAAIVIGYVGIALGIGLTILFISIAAANGAFH